MSKQSNVIVADARQEYQAAVAQMENAARDVGDVFAEMRGLLGNMERELAFQRRILCDALAAGYLTGEIAPDMRERERARTLAEVDRLRTNGRQEVSENDCT